MAIFIERFILSILAALAVLLAVTNPMRFSVASRIGGVASVFILAGLAALYAERLQRKRVRGEQSQQDERNANPAAHPGAKETGKEERIFVGKSITPEYLLGFFHQEQTAVQATNATKDYVGKWVKVAGPVGNVLAGGELFAQVTFARPQQPSLPRDWWVEHIKVYMYFRGPWRVRAKLLKKGDNIAVIGQITEIQSFDLHLDNCEFDDDRPKG